MPRFPVYCLTRGVGVCVVLLVLLYMYIAQRGEVVRCPGDIHSLSQLSHPSTDQQGPLDQGKPVSVPSKDIHVSDFLNVVDPGGSLSTNNDSCILTKTRTNPAFQICIYPPELDIYISASLMSKGVCEPPITKMFQLALRKFPQATVIDAGANIGYYSLLAAAMGHPVIAVEAAKANMEKLAQSVQLNGFADKIYVLHNALADSHRNVSVGVHKNNQGAVKVLENKTDQHLVQTILMDDLIPLIHTRDVIIMMDIEGYECRAISGSAKLFQHVHVAYVFMEWHWLHISHHDPNSACPVNAIRRMTEEHFVGLGYLPHDVRNYRPLDPHSSPQWESGDVYWRHKEHPPLNTPPHGH